MIAESTFNGNIKAEYVYLNSQPLAKIENNNIYYYHNDHLGTPMMMSDSSGSTVWQGEFKPFGEPLSVSGSIINNLRFPGQYYDAETGLHQNGWRDYKTEIGRYVQADPIGLLGGDVNYFVYVWNSPVNYIDPLGLAYTPPSPIKPPRRPPVGGFPTKPVPIYPPITPMPGFKITGCLCPPPNKGETLIGAHVEIRNGSYRCICEYKDCEGTFYRDGRLVTEKK